jgi:hypothetical protein
MYVEIGFFRRIRRSQFHKHLGGTLDDNLGKKAYRLESSLFSAPVGIA